MANNERFGTSATIERMDRKLATAFGAIILIVMLIAAGTASRLYIGLNRQEEDRLAGTIARILDQAINKVAFSGKYHTRLLVEEMKATVPDLEFISVESTDGTVIAHSDPAQNGAVLGSDQIPAISATGTPTVGERTIAGRLVKEVVIPYRGGAGEGALGVIRIGLDIESARQTLRRNLVRVLVLSTLLAAVAMWGVMLLSRRFGGAVRTLAVQLQGITDSAQDAIIMMDFRGRISFWNPAAETILGYRTSEALGHNLHELLAPERYWESHREAFAGFPTSGRGDAIGKTVELAARRKDGKEIAVALSLSAVSISGVWHAVGILRDITEKKRAEEALREESERFAALARVSNTGVWEWHHSARYLWCSPEYFAMLGRAPGDFDVSGRPNLEEAWLDLLHPEDRDRAERHFAGYLASGSPGMFESFYRMRHRDGGWVWIWSRGSTLRDANGQLTDRTVGTHIDITERKQAEEALLQNRNMLDQVLNTIPQSVFWKDRDGRYLGCNLQFARAVGLENPDGIVGKTDFDLPWPKEEAEAYRSDDRFVIENNCAKLHIMEPLQQADGCRLWIDTSKKPLVDSQGGVYGVLGVYEDITKRKQAEEDRERLQAQLIQAQKMESVGRLAGGVAHDFNNMLGVILGHTELALRCLRPAEPLYADLEEIGKAAKRSADLTRQLLAFARKQIVVPKVLDLNSTVEGMLKMLRRLIGENIELTWRPGSGLWPVKMDPSQIDQILANLCVNARDAISGVGKIMIETENVSFDEDYCVRHVGYLPGHFVRLAVSDTGCGMDAETLSRLFEPFFTTKELGKGTGLGLATVYGAVTQNQGFVDVHSERGQGTTFQICLPRYASEAAQEPEEVQFELEACGSETILLVEDEPSILRMTGMMLEMQGYSVMPASTPGEALRVAASYPGRIHLLMTDVIMPEMNGRELARLLMERYPALRVLYMSGYTADVIAHHGVLEEGVHFIQKPFSTEDLVQKIREALEDA